MLSDALSMIYSKWLPDRGGYQYFESSERLGLADDLPTPSLRASSVIGVASTGAGRPLPMGAKPIGFGKLPKGSIVPFDRSGLSGLSASSSTATLVLLGAGAAVAGFFAVKAMRK